MSKHDRTLEAIFATPTRVNIRWGHAVALVGFYGGTVKSSGDSAHKFTMPNGSCAVIHKPHPGNQLSKGRVEAFRDLLIRAGMEPAPPREPDEEDDGHGNADV
ncbi:MAG: type II toxin-antitoxin system HicA family toxin [Isosphaeraceae bacterium]